MAVDERERLDAMLDHHDAASAWFATPPAFGWLSGGDNAVSVAAETGVAAIGYDGIGFTLVANNIDVDRIREEELVVDADVHAFDWYESDLATTITGLADTPGIADFAVPGLEQVSVPSRSVPLSRSERERYAVLCQDAAEVVERVARTITPVTTQRSAAAKLASGLRKRGVTPLVVLTGGEERSQRFRHFTPKAEPLEGYGTFTVVGRRNGLHACLTRTVAFDPPAWLEQRHAATARVAATALAATLRVGREGGAAHDVFAAIEDAYAAVGFEDEWRSHHQGGATGYAGREWFARPDADCPVVMPKAYAWNPTIRGTKVEDTAIVSDDGINLLSTTEEWPTMTVGPVGAGPSVSQPAVLFR